MKVYVVTYVTESGDDGVLGVFSKEPKLDQLKRIFWELLPDEVYDEDYCSVEWDVTPTEIDECLEVLL